MFTEHYSDICLPVVMVWRRRSLTVKDTSTTASDFVVDSDDDVDLTIGNPKCINRPTLTGTITVEPIQSSQSMVTRLHR